jgi:hypothetical protein
MPQSVHIAKLLGPALIAISLTEWLNLDIFAAASGPSFATHVYLNGTLLFIAGLAIVRAHNVWSRQWPLLITLIGWLAIFVGLARMVAPIRAQQVGESALMLYGSLIVLLVTGIVLTYQAYFGSAE